MASVSYTTGTVTVSNASTSVTGTGTNWLTSGIKAGDDFRIAGLTVRIASDPTTNTGLTLAYAWPGGSVSGSNYEVFYRTASDRVLAAALSVLNSLTSGIVTAFSGLPWAADKLAYGTGSGTMALIDFKSWARSFIGAADAAAAKTAAGIAGLTDTQTLTNKTLVDSTTSIVDDGDATKVGKFQLSGVATGTTRTLTWPNASGTIMTRETAETTTALKTVSINTATTSASYSRWSPTDWGTGKPYIGIVKYVTADVWALEFWDGVNSSGTFVINSSGFRSPGAYSTTTANAANVNVASDGTLARSTSSEKYKTDIEPMADEYADAIFDMVPIWYRSTCAMDNPDHSWWGLSAEAVSAIDPRLVHWKTHEMVTEIIEVEREVEGEIVIESVPEQKAVALATPEPEGVAYDRLTVFLINIAQRQKAQIDALEGRLVALEGRLVALEGAA